MKDKPVQRQKFYNAIKEIYKPGVKLTARECSERLKRMGLTLYGTRQESQPRIVELISLGVLEEAGRKWDNATQRMVTIYQRKEA